MEDEEEEVPDEPSELVFSLTRFIVREYAASRHFGISLDEIFDTVNWAHKKEMSDENIEEEACSEQGQAFFCTHLSR